METALLQQTRTVENRRYTRFEVKGVLLLTDGCRTCRGRPLNISLGETICAKIRKLRTYRKLSAGTFLDTPESLEQCIDWLSER
jgi:hypothetical protein